MKLSHVGALAVTLTFTVGHAQPGPSLRAVPEGQRTADTPTKQIISVDLLRQPLSHKAQQLLQKARDAAQAGDHARAIKFLETAHAKYPESDGWTESLAAVEYLKTNQFSAAVNSLENALKLLPRDATDHSNLGYALASLGEYDRAALELRRAITLDHTNPKTGELLDIVLAKAAKAARQQQLGTASNVSSSH
jgi:tetratricopeptide (TPR) repeat protein